LLNGTVKCSRVLGRRCKVLVAEFEYILERHQLVELVAAHAFHVGADDLYHIGQTGRVLVHRIEHLVHLLLVAADHELAVRVMHDVL